MLIHQLYAPILKHFRRSRMERFAEIFEVSESTSVLDMGGNEFNWKLLKVRPKVTILTNQQTGLLPENWIVADGCHSGLPDRAFDVVFSNSVIEHVGDFERQKQFARECARCGYGYYVQTPNRWFPVDPHTFYPFVHWLPQSIFRRLVKFSPRMILSGWAELGDIEQTRFLSKREMRQLFPEAEIIEEKFLGITKSLIAVGLLPSHNRPLS